jgi:hypothetical protein
VPSLTIVSLPAAAGPGLPNAGLANMPSIVDAIRTDCVWVDNRWTYQRGDKRLVCRPNRPEGRDWNWHREGNRYGWYNPRNKSWHYNNW